MNINEQCLLQYLSAGNFSQNFVILTEEEHEILECSEYNEVAWSFI